MATTDGVVTGSDITVLSDISDADKAYTGKSYRRSWWNSYQSRWDGLIPKDVAVDDDDYLILKDITGTPTFTAIVLDNRASSRPSIYWDDAGKTLHCCSFHNTSSEYWEIAYNSGTDTYSFVIGADKAGEVIPDLDREENGKAGAFIVTPNGEIWAFVLTNTGLHMQHRDSGGWETTITTLTSTPDKGCVDVNWFTDGGTNHVCVVAMEDDLNTSPEQWFFFIDEDAATPTTPGNWTDDSSNMTAFDGSDTADDHVCMCKDSTEKLWIIYKADSDDLKVINRSASGTWGSLAEAWPALDAMSRPFCLIKKKDSSTDEELMVLATEVNEDGDVVYKTTDLGTVSFSSESIIITEGTDVFGNGTGPQGDYISDSGSGVAVLGNNLTDNQVWFGHITITAPPVGGDLLLTNRSIANYGGMRQ